MKIGFLYAGQGSQVVSMGQSLYQYSPLVKEVYDQYPDLKQLSFQGPLEELSKTENTQPCMVLLATTITDLLKQNEINPDYVAGLSLGEYSSLHCTEVFDFQTVVEIVRFRGQATKDAVIDIDSKMAAVMSMERSTLEKICKQASNEGVVSIANYNCPGQLVIAGESQAVEKASELALKQGARRVIPLNTSGPFHTVLLKEASLKLKEQFKTITFNPMKVPVVFNCLGSEKGNQQIPYLLEKQVMSPVYFEDSIRYMLSQGVDTLIEIGPGKVLSGFVRKIDKSIKTYQVEDEESLKKVCLALKGEDYEIKK